MKKNLRPGYLAGFQGLISRATRNKQRNKTRPRTGLGAFGKGSFVPMPGAPAGGVPMEDAINTSTGQTYIQDPRCPEGEKMVQKMEPCAGTDCCDGGDCDPPGTLYPEDDCEDDPSYQQRPQAPPAPEPQQQAQPQQAQVQQSAAPQAQETAEPAEPTEAQQAELLKLSEEAAQTESIVTAAPTLAPPSAYTGSPPPAYAPTRAPKAPQDQQVIMDLVAQHRESRPVAPTRRPAPARAIQQEAASPAPTDLLSWLRGAIFGSSDGMEGWSENKLYKYGVPLAALTVIVFIWMRSQK